MIALVIAADLVPAWMQIAIAGGAVVGAIGILWAKVVRPGARLITDAEQMLPLLKDLPILREIIAQLRTDSGSSLRDIIERLEANDADAAASRKELSKTAADLASAVEVVKQLATEDRRLAREDRITLAKLIALAELGGASNLRTEATAEVVAADLAAAQGRAHEVDTEQPAGAASDAASRPAPE